MNCRVPEAQISGSTFGIPSVPIRSTVSIKGPHDWALSFSELTVNLMHIIYIFICEVRFVLKEAMAAYGSVKVRLHPFLEVTLFGRE
jgi:hypothetical protein